MVAEREVVGDQSFERAPNAVLAGHLDPAQTEIRTATGDDRRPVLEVVRWRSHGRAQLLDGLRRHGHDLVARVHPGRVDPPRVREHPVVGGRGHALIMPGLAGVDARRFG